MIGGTSEVNITATDTAPSTSDGNALGTSSLMWSDLFLASGGVVNFNNGDITLTHSANDLAFAGGTLTLPNTGLHLLDTNDTHDLIIAPGSNLTADHTLTLTTGDADRTLTLSGNSTLDDWFDQAVKQASNPTFGDLTITSFAANWTNAGRTVADLGAITTVDINGGTVDGITSLTVGNNVDIGNYDIRALSGTFDSLTSGRVAFVSTNGLLVDDSDFTFATDTLTATKIGAFQAAGAIDFDSQNMTNVDIDSGTIDGVTITSPALSGTTTGTFTVGGTVTINAFTLGGTLSLAENAPIALDSALSADGKYSGITEGGTAGAALAFGDLVYFAVADSRWELADADAAATSFAKLGVVVLAAAGDGNATTVLLWGKVRADTAFPTLTIGAPVHIGTTAGDIQVAAPTGSGDIVRIIGYGNTANELYFCPDNTYVELS
tara:strand:- start:682 stop:1989 length:1308 start_codon:yes stop_codon:yes gene_type:complete